MPGLTAVPPRCEVLQNRAAAGGGDEARPVGIHLPSAEQPRG